MVNILFFLPYAPIDVFADSERGGHTRTFDLSSKPVGRGLVIFESQGPPQGRVI